MKLTKHDIGAEIISILTRGMYPDPRDAVREYIQNAIDAKAKSVEVKVRQNTVVIEDTGFGMNNSKLRRAVRLGVSDKVPGKDVGFMGIGIYSAFHLCDSLSIYSRMAKGTPSKLTMDFAGMRRTLAEEQKLRLEDKIDGDNLTDLQSLLEAHISFTDDGALPSEEFPIAHGTSVELDGLVPSLAEYLSDFDSLSSYLRDVVPLKFDPHNFKWGKEIETKIKAVCSEHDAQFELVDLKLAVQGQAEQLYRPYHDGDFADDEPRKPIFKEIKQGNKFLGVAWGCLNSARRRIATKQVRGFILKKQGFSIGKRENLARYFGPSNTHFDRFVGEIIVTHHELLPNAARNGLETSSLQKWFFKEMADRIGPFFSKHSDDFQNESKTAETISEYGGEVKKLFARFNENEEDPDRIIESLTDLAEIKRKLKSSNTKATSAQKITIKELLEEADQLKELLDARVDHLVKHGNAKRRKTEPKRKINFGKGLANYDANQQIEKHESLIDLVRALELDPSESISQLLALIDERFIQAVATNKAEYYRMLHELKAEMEASDT